MPRARASRGGRAEARILVVDDAPDTLELIQRNLASQGYEVFTAASAAEALPLLDSIAADLLVTDVRMPGLSGIDLVRAVRGRYPEIEIIVITGYPTIEGAVEALHVGAWDYLAKPFTDEELFQAVRRALTRRAGPRPARPAAALTECHGLLGGAVVMRSLFDALAAEAGSDRPLLLRGESGSGREAAARALHALAGRSGPFLRVSLDARSLVPAGVPAEDFLAGLARSCAQGTLYLVALDGAGDAVLQAVAGLLAGGRHASKSTAARLVVSAAADLEALARRGGAMSELLRRLEPAIAIPPLRERGDDLLLLAHRFLAEASAQAGAPARALTEAAEQALRSYSWPGNVRELRDLATRLALAGGRGPIGVGELPRSIAGLPGRESTRDLSLEAAEREHIAEVLRRTAGNKSRAAEILGIDRKTLRDKLRET
jgi:DNA-binding NtrC family response regulator